MMAASTPNFPIKHVLNCDSAKPIEGRGYLSKRIGISELDVSPTTTIVVLTYRKDGRLLTEVRQEDRRGVHVEYERSSLASTVAEVASMKACDFSGHDLEDQHMRAVWRLAELHQTESVHQE